MFTVEQGSNNVEESYKLLIKQLHALLDGETNTIANLSNASALLNLSLKEINWVGFYLIENDELVLGPFQGLPACVRIPVGKGVCGTAVQKKETLRISNVHEFPGHIACDAASQSEIVIPLIKNQTVIGVLDIDSPFIDRFNDIDQYYLEQFVHSLMSYL